jgi:hypothetical protein
MYAISIQEKRNEASHRPKDIVAQNIPSLKINGEKLCHSIDVHIHFLRTLHRFYVHKPFIAQQRQLQFSARV